MRVFTCLGPSQSGKTSLVAALASLEGRPEVSELSEQVSITRFSYLSDDWTAIDIAGGTDNLGLAGHALAASDAALVCVPPDPAQAVLASPYFRLVAEAGQSCFLFVNRIDATSERVRDIVAALQAFSTQPILIRQIPVRGDDGVIGAVDLISERAWRYLEGKPSALIEMPEEVAERETEARAELLEHLADFDDALLEQLVEDKTPATRDVYKVATDALGRHGMIPALLGSATHMNGVTRLMKSLRHETPHVSATVAELVGAGDETAVSVLADIRKHVGKVVVLRALGAPVRAGAQLGGAAIGNLTGLDGRTTLAEAGPGEICVAVKSDHLKPGMLLSDKAGRPLPDWAFGAPPAMHRIISPASEMDDARLSAALTRLAETDPGLALSNDATSGELIASTQGPMHLRRILTKLSDDFGVEAVERPVTAHYRETMSRPVQKHYRHRKQSGGAGQFADVHLSVRPQPRGAGFAFDETVKGGAVPRNYFSAVEAGAGEALACGPLGFPVVDVAVTLTDGKHHAVDSSDFAFKTAARMGVREALAEGGPLLLQPIHQIEVHLPGEYSGAMVTLINSLKGQVQGFDAHPTAKGWDIFHALLPAAQHEALSQAIGGATQGTAWYRSDFDHYEEVFGKEAETIARAQETAPV